VSEPTLDPAAFAHLLEITGGDLEFVDELIDTYLDDGLVQLEAMHLGKPVVSTRLGTGVEFVNVAGETGLLVPPGDGSALRDAIRGLLADADLRRRLGEAGRARVASTFSVEQMVQGTLDVYRDTLRPVATR